MNRETKFRAWGIDFMIWRYFSLKDLIAGKVGNLNLKNWLEYTGLKDKNGKEIYEGDVVSHNKGKIIIEWKEFGDCCVGGVGFNLRTGDFGYNPDSYEVIGNIYENPDLLK